MKSRYRWGGSAVAAFLALGAATGAARSDDWRQYRRDANRSAVSSDRLEFPLTEVWTFGSEGSGLDGEAKPGESPLYHAVVAGGKVYFTALKGNRRHLICADAKTGSVAWSQPLETSRLKFPISHIAGPAVSEGGRVFVYDWMTGAPRPGRMQHTGQGSQSSGAVEAVNSFVVRTFDAKDGKPGPLFPLAAMGANGVLPRLSLMDNLVGGQEVRPVPPTFVGCPP